MRLNVNRWFGVLVLFLFVGIAVEGYAQPPREGKPKGHVKEFLERKKNYLIKETGMSREEVNAFFPLYNALQTKKLEIQRNVRQKMKSIDHAKEPVSEENYRDALRVMNQSRAEEAKLEDEYFKQFSKILSPEKLYKLQRAELNFNREMLRGFCAPEHRKK